MENMKLTLEQTLDIVKIQRGRKRSNYSVIAEAVVNRS